MRNHEEFTIAEAADKIDGLDARLARIGWYDEASAVGLACAKLVVADDLEWDAEKMKAALEEIAALPGVRSDEAATIAARALKQVETGREDV